MPAAWRSSVLSSLRLNDFSPGVSFCKRLTPGCNAQPWEVILFQQIASIDVPETG